MRWLSVFFAVVAGALLAINIYGLGGASDHAKMFEVRQNDSEISALQAWREIAAARAAQERGDTETYLKGLTSAVHKRMSNPREADVRDRHAMAPRIEGSWPLWLVNRMSGGRFDNYEYQRPDAALRRGLGSCGAQAIVLARLLEQDGYYATLRGSPVHMTVDAAGWWLDPDYGVALEAPASDAQIVRGYAEKPLSVAAEHFAARPQIQDISLLAGVRYPLNHFYGLEPQTFETIAVWIKWGVPLGLLALSAALGFLWRRRALKR